MRDVFLLGLAVVSTIAAIVGMLWLSFLGSANVVPPIAACGGMVAVVGVFWAFVRFLKQKTKEV